MTYPKNRDILLPMSLFVLTVVTRLPFTSKFLYHMDSVHFALALEKYDVRVHQPHPPGYFLYVMLGRLINYFIKDANSTFVLISIIFSGLTVVAIYYLGKEIYDKKIGIIAAALALTSPNLWFHGEVALTYIVEAFFSTLVAFFCWKIYKGEHKYVWLSVITLGVAGGIRQNTMVFLFPLWLFSVKGIPLRRVVLSFALLGLVCLSWFIPMVWMTSGFGVYREALRDLWLFNTGHVSVFEKGWSSFKVFSSTLFDFTFYGIGTGVFILGLAAYSLIRHKGVESRDKPKLFFFIFWIFPAVFFYLLVFIHPANPGYVLIFLPALLILAAASILHISNELGYAAKNNVAVVIVLAIMVTNSYIFVFMKYPVSYEYIRSHNRDLPVMLEGIKAFDPKKSVIFIGPYIFYGYRQIMYYLPEYRVYQVDVRTLPTGRIRKTFWGMNRQTYLADEIVLPASSDKFLIVFISDDKDVINGKRGVNIKQLNSDICIASGDIKLIKSIYPELRVRWNGEN